MRAPLLLAAAIAGCSLASLPSVAEERKLATDEIRKAFAGNSVHGMWGQTEYYSFFDPGGSTDYTTKRGTDRGRWRAAHDQYCSQWQMSGESCYDIYRDGDRIIWVVPSSGARYDSTLVPDRRRPCFHRPPAPDSPASRRPNG
jgi:hypothetical protein